MPACIVVYDDEGSLCLPYTFDPDCEGAVCNADGPVALFPDRKAARKAIRISTKFAELQLAQGVPCNEDFVNYKRFIKIRPVVSATGGGDE